METMEEKLSARVALIMSSGLLFGALLALYGLANGSAAAQAVGETSAEETLTHVASSPRTNPDDALRIE